MGSTLSKYFLCKYLLGKVALAEKNMEHKTKKVFLHTLPVVKEVYQSKTSFGILKGAKNLFG